eukprot:627607-Prymnesium_polylepis.1
MPLTVAYALSLQARTGRGGGCARGRGHAHAVHERCAVGLSARTPAVGGRGPALGDPGSVVCLQP